MPVYIESENIITSLGFSAGENMSALEAGKSGIRSCHNRAFSATSFPAAMIDWKRLSHELTGQTLPESSGFGRLAFYSVSRALSESSVDPSDPATVFILSTTKGNIDQLKGKGTNAGNDSLYLWHSAELLRMHFGNPNKAVVVSNACISGLLAMITGLRLIKAGIYDHAVVVGADVISGFVVSGFQSFLSLSAEPCKPFDRSRDGLTLGEGAGTVVLSKQKPEGKALIEMVTGSSANDANHISGPSRTGEGLFIALSQTMAGAAEDPCFISAHGTATPFNDDMESFAVTRAGLAHIPVFSLKGSIGHTLGAAGIVESVIAAACLRENKLIKNIGLQQQGLANPLYTPVENIYQPFRSFIKMASGFGGCNAAALFKKHE